VDQIFAEMRPNTASETETLLLLPVITSSIVISPYALLAGRTITAPPAAPGTAPRTANRPRATSTLTTSRFWVLCCTAPLWPDFFLPGKTRPGVWR